MVYTNLNGEIDVGSSGHLLELGPFKMLVDCGMHPKRVGLESLPALSKIIPESLDFIAITHAHLDHCGALPVVARHQERAQIMAASENCELILRMLRNSRAVQGRQREELGIKEYPLYDYSAIDALRRRIFQMPYMRERSFESGGEKISITFYPAGHIPAAASILAEYRRQKIFFTGDISFHSTGILKGAMPPKGRIDTIVTETTRGSYDRPEGQTYESEAKRFTASVNRVLGDGGSVLVPAFALGRMQDIIQLINASKRRGEIPSDAPVYAGGLGLDLAEHFLRESKRSETFSFNRQHMEGVRPLRAEIIPGKDFDEKGIYVLGSGMMVERTPSYLAAAAMMNQRANAIFLVGYADDETPAGRLMKTPYGSNFSFPDLLFVGTLNCRVDKFDLTSHADRGQLLEFILEREPRNVILTHGSPESREWFMDQILDLSPKTAVIIPEPLQSYEI
ncbi:MAG: MBL fold metallo-hydrolase [Verrucomicrobia bacterium]|nr:MAG: MBL fold metallo-hydrolase [Verrucomicrobiota bacterium]